jgi:hypothetical protein
MTVFAVQYVLYVLNSIYCMYYFVCAIKHLLDEPCSGALHLLCNMYCLYYTIGVL